MPQKLFREATWIHLADLAQSNHTVASGCSSSLSTSDSVKSVIGANLAIHLEFSQPAHVQPNALWQMSRGSSSDVSLSCAVG